MFVEQQISILEWFLKDHVTLKTVMMLKIQLWSQQTITFYNIFKLKTDILNNKHISIFLLYQINAALLSRRDFFQKYKKILLTPNYLNGGIEVINL